MDTDIELQRQRIIERRKALGLTQRDVMRSGAVSQASLSRIEKGTKAASVPELMGIAFATGSTVGYLTGKSELMARVKTAARASDDADAAPVRDRLRYLLEMDALLDSVLE